MRILLVLIFLIATSFCFSQDKIGVGGAAMYNIQTGGIGVDARVLIPTTDFIYVVPNVYYFPSFNKVHELFLGVNIQYDFIAWKDFVLYLMAGGFYDHWFNAADSPKEDAKTSNIIPEAGGGLYKQINCWRPFIEQRYNFIWKEGTARIGIIWFPGCKPKKKKKKHACPAYD